MILLNRKRKPLREERKRGSAKKRCVHRIGGEKGRKIRK